ncbi:uncharacterized protein LTR77_009635 [Saxophila tyrrhenica]|uniref:CAP-Gly domain-containing protein n=1 Tax=Saxophila tyrrhenica TaxID=1690608 RepID=A0AAV9P226_9PEZI|nr:hypothetical protein LTR77_009635 [Saxophila tyrrhenica]
MKDAGDGPAHHIGERLSLKNQLCTVRYVGKVADKPGTWLGVEWDDIDRRKHNGTHEGVEYFRCLSKSPKCASFLRPTQTWDAPRTFLQALREKYMPDDHHATSSGTVYFSGKQAEEVGFDKFQQRQAKLQGIHVLVLNHMRIQHQRINPSDNAEIAHICADITELDLSANLFESYEEICDLCLQFPKLRTLTLDGNRFSLRGNPLRYRIETIKTLGLSRTLAEDAAVNVLLNFAFPNVTTLSLAGNEYSIPLKLRIPSKVEVLDLSDNTFAVLSDLSFLSGSGLRTLLLKRNSISSFTTLGIDFKLQVEELDLSYNVISTFDFFNNITESSFPNLHHLRVTGNPVYQSLVSADGKPLTSEDGYMLTVARLPQLQCLNHSKITEKERLNAETYYLGQIAIELANAPEGQEGKVIAQHPRSQELCAEYGEPVIQRKTKKDAIDPNTLAARLTSVTFHLADHFLPEARERSWTADVPKSFAMYAVFGLVGKRLNQMPLTLRLVLETNERDPVGLQDRYGGPEWWDSSDDEAEVKQDDEWMKREVELTAGTRALTTYVEGNTAIVRAEAK